MGSPIVDPHVNEWLGLLMDWELPESSCTDLTYEGGASASDYECSNIDLGLHDSTSCKYTCNSALIFNHTSTNTHNTTINSNSLHLNANLSKAQKENTSLSSQQSSASPTSTTSKSLDPSSKVAAETPNYHIDTRSQAVVKETSYFSSHNGVGGRYNTIIKLSDIKEGQILPHETNSIPLISAGRQQGCVRSNAGNGVVMRHLASVKNKASNTHVLSRRSKANDSVLEQVSELSKASDDNVQLGQKLVNMKRDDNLLQLISGIHQEDKEPRPWPSSSHLAKSREADASYSKTITAFSSQPHCGKKMTTSAYSPSAQPVVAKHQYSKSFTLSFNQHNNPTSKRPHNYHDHDDEFHNNSSLGLLFKNHKHSLINESELDDMSGMIGNDDESSFALITNTCKTRKMAKVEDDSSARHCLAERKRREKLNKNFDELHAIVGPSLSVKTDKASIIEAAIKLLNDEKGLRPESEVSTTKIMRNVVNMRKEISNFHSQIIPKDGKVVLWDGSSSSFQVDSHPHKTKPHITFSEVFCDLEADFDLGTMGSSSCNSHINVTAKQQSPQRWHYIIIVRAPNRPNILSDIITMLSKLGLQVIFANSCLSNNNTLSVASPTMTWFLLKVEVVEKFSSFDPNKCEIIHNAIKGCIIKSQGQQRKIGIEW